MEKVCNTWALSASMLAATPVGTPGLGRFVAETIAHNMLIQGDLRGISNKMVTQT